MIRFYPKNLLLLFICFASFSITKAQGDLMIMPKRLVFDGSQRTQEINLANTGSDTAIYAISFVQYKMTENGNFEQIETSEEDQRFATDFLRYYPRRVSLGPNEAQTVRVQLNRTGNLEQGEYRSHMYFRAVEEQKALGEETQEDADGISINIKTVFGISIPIIIRHGASTTKIDLQKLKLQKENESYQLSVSIARTGNMSVYGDLLAEHISPSGKTTEIGKVKGVSVYTPNSKRNFSFQLNVPEDVDMSSGKLKLTYTSDKDKKLDSAEINLQ